MNKTRKQYTTRMYNFTDAELYTMCVNTYRNAVRDYVEFEKFGYSSEKIQGFASQIEKFRHLPDDNELVGDQMLLTEKKYDAAERLKNAIRSVMTRVEMKYNKRSGRYRKFGTSKIGDMTDAQLLFCGRRVARVARLQIDFLADTGLRDEHIQKVLDYAISFENAINLQQDRIHERDISVEVRVEQGNRIYQHMIDICNIGKDIWIDKDRIKYDQYCVYESNAEQKQKSKAAKKNKEDKE